MDIDHERLRPVGTNDIRDAVLALSLVPPVAFARFSGEVLHRSAGFAAELVNVSPFRTVIHNLDGIWREQIAEVEQIASDTLELVVEWILARVDVNAIVAEKVDVEAVVQRVDVIALAREVIVELDIPEIVRNSSQTMAAETVDGLRKHGMSADRTVSEFIDRLVGRKPRRGPPPRHTRGLEQPT
jgi:hypothetical protein